METKLGANPLSKTSLLNRYNIQSNSLLQYLDYNHNKHSPDRQHIYTPIMKEDEYQQKWQHQFLRQLQQELNADQPVLPYFDNRDHIEYRGDRLSRQIHLGVVQKAVHKNKKKDFDKYKAYAVKLKIPSFHQLNRPTTKEEKSNFMLKDKNIASSAYIKQIQELINPKLPTSLKESMKQYIRTRNYESINDRKIFKRHVKSSQNQKNLNIRKRSIRHVQKKETQQIRNDVQKNNECSPQKVGKSKGLKKQKKISQRPNVVPCLEPKHSQVREIDRNQGRNHQVQIRQLTANEKMFKSPKIMVEKQEDAKINYLEKGINFKRKQKQSPKQVQNLNEKKAPSLLSKKIKKQGSAQHMNQSITQAVVRETPRNFLLQSLMLSKETKMRKTQNMDEMKYMSKQQKCIKQTKINKIISFNSQDKYIRRILQGLGWVVNPDNRSKFYHLKWVFKPATEDYNLIREGQYINHIKNSHQLTSKNCLNKNLKAYFSQWTNLYDYYPQCYDISKPSQKQQFFEEYTKQFMMLLLRKIYTYIQTVQCEHIQQLKLKYQKLLAHDGLYSTDAKLMSFMRKKQFRNIEMENYKCFRSDFTLHINLVTIALKYWRFLRKQQEFEGDDAYHFLNYNQKEIQNNLGYLETYSQMSTPTFSTDSLQYFTKEFYSTPSNIVIERIVKEYVYFHRKYYKRWKVFGQGNIWIVKPCSASRGNGIYLQNNCKQILFNSKGIQARIVQKYIERPLLFRNPSFPQICNRKFDIRQWVLLRSVDPLEIHMFSHCYVRICSQGYNIENINNLKSHLTNYSFNKQHFKNPEESVLDYNTFKNLLMSEYKVDYEKQIKDKIKKIIIKSIKSAQELLNDYGKRCFSLLGYDILLDQNINPWLLEVNMSPACEQRTQWLKNYLKEMGKGMLQIVLPKQYLQIEKEIESLQNGAGQQKKKRIETKTNELIELKRIKTEMSHEILAPLLQNQSKINHQQSEINQQKEDDKQLELEMSQLKQDESVVYEQEQQITYQDFIKENLVTEEQGYYADYQEVQKTQQVNKNQINQEAAQFTDFQGMRTEEDNNHPIFSQIQIAVQKTKLQTQVQQMNAQSEEYQEDDDYKVENQLRWELICFQQYHGRRKQIDGLIQISGLRITNEIVRSNDIKIDQFEETRDQILNSIIKVQSQIKNFLKRKLIERKKNEQIKSEQKIATPIKQQVIHQKIQTQKELQNVQSPIKSDISLQQKQNQFKQSLRLNFSRISSKTKSQRKPRSRSVLDGELQSIWHYSYVHTYREGVIEKVEVVKNETVLAKKSPKHKKLKNFYENQVRDKTSSAAVNAVTDVSVSYLQQLLQKRNKRQQKEEEVEVEKQLQSEISIEKDKESEVQSQVQVIKEDQSRNLID